MRTSTFKGAPTPTRIPVAGAPLLVAPVLAPRPLLLGCIGCITTGLLLVSMPLLLLRIGTGLLLVSMLLRIGRGGLLLRSPPLLLTCSSTPLLLATIAISVLVVSRELIVHDFSQNPSRRREETVEVLLHRVQSVEVLLLSYP